MRVAGSGTVCVCARVCLWTTRTRECVRCAATVPIFRPQPPHHHHHSLRCPRLMGIALRAASLSRQAGVGFVCQTNRCVPRTCRLQGRMGGAGEVGGGGGGGGGSVQQGAQMRVHD